VTASTIQIFLPDGNPRGLRLAEITSRTVKVVCFPRAEFRTKALKSPELERVGMYLLVGKDVENGADLVYVGQAEGVGKRIGQHDARKDWWEVALVAVSKTEHFTNAHVRYLEWFCHDAIRRAQRFGLENEVQPTKPHVSESLAADLAGDFDTIRTLTGTLGYPLFDELARANTGRSIVQLKIRGARARAIYGEDGLVVLEGSRGPVAVTASARGTFVEAARERLLQAKVIRSDGKEIVFNRDYAFGTPSNAAAVVAGRHTNGWVEWKYADGRTLDEAHRSKAPDE
jgi:hypothetical protein